MPLRARSAVGGRALEELGGMMDLRGGFRGRGCHRRLDESTLGPGGRGSPGLRAWWVLRLLERCEGDLKTETAWNNIPHLCVNFFNTCKSRDPASPALYHHTISRASRGPRTVISRVQFAVHLLFAAVCYSRSSTTSESAFDPCARHIRVHMPFLGLHKATAFTCK